MNQIFTAAFAVLVGAAPIVAFAAPTLAPVTDGRATTPAAPGAAHPHRSTVHHANGERFDVPKSLLRNHNTLINGLPPESLQFE